MATCNKAGSTCFDCKEVENCPDLAVALDLENVEALASMAAFHAEENPSDAVGYAEKAAEQRHPFGCYLYGKALMEGEWIEFDPVDGYAYLKIARDKLNIFKSRLWRKVSGSIDDLDFLLAQSCSWLEVKGLLPEAEERYQELLSDTPEDD